MKRPSPSMLVAIFALIIALTGTAIALPGRNTVKSADIAPHNVKTSDLAGNAVVPTNTNLVRSDVKSGLVQTISTTPTALGGPSVTVRVTPGSLVAIHAQAELRRAGGGGGNFVRVHLHEASALSVSPDILGTDSTLVSPRFTAPGPGVSEGVASSVRSGWLVLSNVPPGKRTFSLQYSTEAGTGLFEDRRLQVAVIR